MSMMFEDREAYAIAEAKAVQDVRDLDPELVAAERGVEYNRTEGEFLIPLLGKTVHVAYPGGKVFESGGRILSGAVAVISLHYLVYRGEPLRREGWLAYRDMPGGRDFSRAFESMAESKLAQRFGARPEDLLRAAQALGGERADLGEYSCVVRALPRVPLMIVVWPACEDAGGAARVLFQPSAPYYLHTEDLAALGTVAAERLLSQAGNIA